MHSKILFMTIPRHVLPLTSATASALQGALQDHLWEPSGRVIYPNHANVLPLLVASKRSCEPTPGV